MHQGGGTPGINLDVLLHKGGAHDEVAALVDQHAVPAALVEDQELAAARDGVVVVDDVPGGGDGVVVELRKGVVAWAGAGVSSRLRRVRD